jgi:hypothetical protein
MASMAAMASGCSILIGVAGDPVVVDVDSGDAADEAVSLFPQDAADAADGAVE